MPKIIHPNGILLSTIADKTGGTIVGDPQAKVFSLCSSDKPEKNGITFLKSTKGKEAFSQLIAHQISAVMIASNQNLQVSGVNLLLVDDPVAAFVKIIPLFFEDRPLPSGISSKAEISPSAKIGKNVAIGAFCWIGDGVEIGDNTVLFSNVSVYPGARIGHNTVLHSSVSVREDCIVGNNCILHNGVAIGADGFGYYPDPKFGLRKVPQIGIAVVGDNVEIGANTCIDRATLGETHIGFNTKLDNLVQVGHNVTIGSNSIVCGTVGIGGSCDIGNQVILGGGCGIGDHVSITDGCRLGGHAATAYDLKEKQDYMGYPAIPLADWMRLVAVQKQLPSLVKKLKKLIKEEASE